jgi:PAS domain-containing protein
MPGQLPKKHALIIQAVDSSDESQQRADRVLKTIIDPACKATDYDAVLANEPQAQTIVEPIISALNTHPLVIADLAAPPWNPNVLMEVGFRLATGRPIVLLADTDPKPEIAPLRLRNVHTQLINSTNPEREVRSLIEAIKQYGPEVNAWESDYPTIEFSIGGPDGGRFIFANERAAQAYGLHHADDLIGRPIQEVDAKLHNFLFPDDGYRQKYDEDQLRILGQIAIRDQKPKTAKVPLWFTQHSIPDQNGRIYWPVLTQYRYFSQNAVNPDRPPQPADIVMRVIFIDVHKWDAMDPRPHQPGQVLSLPELFKEPPAEPEYDVFLSYNSQDLPYVSDLYQMLGRCGLEVWFDMNKLGGATTGLTPDLIRGLNSSRIFALVLGRNGLGPWQREAEAIVELQNFVQGGKHVVLLLLPDIEEGRWKNYLSDRVLEAVLKDRLRAPLPTSEELRNFMIPGSEPNVAEQLLRLVPRLLHSR